MIQAHCSVLIFLTGKIAGIQYDLSQDGDLRLENVNEQNVNEQNVNEQNVNEHIYRNKDITNKDIINKDVTNKDLDVENCNLTVLSANLDNPILITNGIQDESMDLSKQNANVQIPNRKDKPKKAKAADIIAEETLPYPSNWNKQELEAWGRWIQKPRKKLKQITASKAKRHIEILENLRNKGGDIVYAIDVIAEDWEGMQGHYFDNYVSSIN